jgi:hypothetical protein
MPHSLLPVVTTSNRWRRTALLLACLAGLGNARADRAAAEPAAGSAVRESAPEIFYMQDDAGRLVPVPGFRYRDFVELLRLQEGLPGTPEPPAVVLETATVRVELPAAAATGADAPPLGSADRALARATVELTLRQTRGGWASLPIGLEGLLLSAPPRYEGAGRVLMEPAPTDGAGREATAPPAATGGGYRLWVTGPVEQPADGTRHTIILEGSLTVEVTPVADSFGLRMPRATAALVEIRSPRIDPVVSVRPAAVVPEVAMLPDAAGSLVTLVGLAGTVQIRLGERGSVVEPGARVVTAAAVPQAFVESVLRIDGRAAVTEATIRLENLPAGTRAVRVALPPRAGLRSIRSPAALQSLEGTAAAAEAVVRVEPDASGGCVVEMECERPVDVTGREPFQPLGFAVDSIPPWRQWGRLVVVADGEWQVDWDDLGALRRIDPPASARRPGFVAAFAYDAQPAAVALRVRPRGSRVVIEPEYRYDVAAFRVSLDARLRVAIRGAPVSRIAVDLDGWDVDEVGPAGVVDSAAVSISDGAIVIPFVQPLSGDAVVELRCGRQIPADAAEVEWRIPSPQADLVGPASILVTSQSDIELLPDAARLQGLVRQFSPPSLRGDAERAALAYRLDGSVGIFRATRRFLPRRVDASVSAQVEIDARRIAARETIRFDVAHVPLEFVTLIVPAQVVEAGTLEVRQNGLLLNPEEDPATAPEPPEEAGAATDQEAVRAGERPVRLRAMLALPILGAGELTVAYDVPLSPIPPESTLAEDFPLVLPIDTRIGRQSLMLTAPETLSIDVRGDAWKRESAALGSIASRTWTTTRPQVAMPLAISARKRSPVGETVVEAAWMQTRLSAGRREDTFRFAVRSGASEQITFFVPPGMAPPAGPLPEAAADGRADVEVRLDGRRQPGSVRPDGRVVVDLPRRVGEATWLVELVARRDHGGPLTGVDAASMPVAVVLEPPSFPAGTVQRRFYWELLLEPDQHALGHPSGWTSQQRWTWQQFGLHRVPIVTREALVSWFDAALAAPSGSPLDLAAADAVPAAAARRGVDAPVDGPRLVYAGIGPPPPGRIVVVPTWLLVLCASGAVLAAGLAAVYRPALCRLPVLVGAAAVAGLAVAAFPDVAPIVAQAAVPGAVLAVAAAILRPLVEGRTVVPRNRGPGGGTSSLTEVAPHPSLIITAPPSSRVDDATAVGRFGP